MVSISISGTSGGSLEELTDRSDSFQHVLTASKRPQPEEARGGIIADDMGLGKTLVILSTVASTLKDAAQFASMHTERSSTKRPSQAALIFAPSTRNDPMICISCRETQDTNLSLVLIDNWIDEIRT
jgi:SWI/SNF-related matrix-associated actin-dependent regulator of chromatin subfamily A3